MIKRVSNLTSLTSGNGGLDIIVPVAFWRALICKSALNGARHIGQLFAWYLNESAQELHRHKCLHGKINVSRTSLMQITHSEPLSSVSSSLPCCCIRKPEEKKVKLKLRDFSISTLGNLKVSLVYFLCKQNKSDKWYLNREAIIYFFLSHYMQR